MGINPPKTDFPSLEMQNVTPQAFAKTWEKDMEEWGNQIKSSVEGVTRMLSDGLGVGSETLLEAGKFGPHLLAPTATDLDKYGKEGESEFEFSRYYGKIFFSRWFTNASSILVLVFAGFHTDLNFITIHGNSRYPVSINLFIAISLSFS